MTRDGYLKGRGGLIATYIWVLNPTYSSAYIRQVRETITGLTSAATNSYYVRCSFKRS